MSICFWSKDGSNLVSCNVVVCFPIPAECQQPVQHHHFCLTSFTHVQHASETWIKDTPQRHDLETWLNCVRYDSCMCDMTCSCQCHVWHDSFMCDMTDSLVIWLILVWNDSEICLWDMTQSCATWLIHVWHTSNPSSFSCWIQMRGVTRSNAWPTILVGFFLVARHLGSLTAANWVSFDFNFSYSSCWGYSLINTFKLKSCKRKQSAGSGWLRAVASKPIAPAWSKDCFYYCSEKIM